jgi:uncharacterized protein YjiK
MQNQVVNNHLRINSFTALLTLLTGVLLMNCADSGQQSKESFVIPYNFDQPEEYKLNDELHEISGISSIQHIDELLAVNDERGELYRINSKGVIISHKLFHKGGDYEDLAVVGNSVYVMKSNGNLYFIPDFNAAELESETYKAKLRDGMEFESLAYDSVRQQLLLLVKDGDSREGKAPVYVFDLRSRVFHPKPELLIDPKKISGMKIKGKSLRASAMSRHPKTGEWYILSSINRMVLVCDANGDGKGFIHLSKKILPQPEGICFARNGDLFISSEGMNKQARLLRYAYLPDSD